jgi:hypothetical protein
MVIPPAINRVQKENFLGIMIEEIVDEDKQI